MGSGKMVRLKGTSLIEATIALAIISIVFSVGWMAANHVLNATPIVKQYRAEQAINAIWQQTKINQRLFDEEVTRQEWLVRKEVKVHPVFKNTYVLSFYAIDQQGKVILEKHDNYHVQQ